MTAETTEYKVYVRRSPYSTTLRDSGCMIPLGELWDIRWDWETGGNRKNTPTCFLMGKITLEVAQNNAIGLSGDHDYSSGIKVCIIKKYTPKETWKHLIEVYGPSPDWGNRKGETPCTTQIINLLKATPHNYVCGALRKFCPLILLRFLAIHQVLLQKRAASGCKILSQIALTKLCGIALKNQITKV